MKIIIFGASGSGTTTMAKSLAKKLNYTHLDADDYYWEKTIPPFQIKIPLETRHIRLKTAFQKQNNTVISGSLVNWGDYWKSAFDLGIFLKLPQKIRIKRLRKREWERYGDELKSDPKINQNSRAFLQYAEQYDNTSFSGRSFMQHQKWMKVLSYPVIKLEGDLTNEERIQLALQEIESK